MLLKQHELIQITNDETIVYNSEMTQIQKGVFYYKLKDILMNKGLYLYSTNKQDDGSYLYRIEVI